MINQKPQRVSFLSLGLGLIFSLFISIQLLPPASRIRLAAVVGAMVGITVTDMVFFGLRFVFIYL
jgi:hypothetical protein